jgi:hypothetical protein
MNDFYSLAKDAPTIVRAIEYYHVVSSESRLDGIRENRGDIAGPVLPRGCP